MIFSHKKLLIFNLKLRRTMILLKIREIILCTCIVFTSVSIAQEADKMMKKSNDFIFEGNELVSEDFISAEKEYRKAISKLPSNSIGSYNLGHAYYNSGHFDEALLRHIEAAKNTNSKEEKHAAFHNIGNILMQKKLCKEAVEAFKNALRNNPSDDESRYNLALAKECAKNQGGGEDDDEKDDDEKKDDENKDEKDQNEDGDDKKEENDNKGDDNEDNNEGDDNEDDEGKPKDEKDNKEDNKPGDKKKKKQQPQPGKLSPQQVKNLLEAMNNHEKKVQEKINAKKTKGVKVKTDKDW